MADEASGPTWLKLGGLLSGIAALLSAIVAAVALLVDIWPTGPGTSDVKPPPPETSEVKPPPPRPPATPTAGVVNLVRYQADGCFYAVELLESDNADHRIRFPFNLAASVPADDIQPAAYADPSALRREMTVFVPGERANPQAVRHEFYKQAIVDDVLEGVVHVRFKQEDQCPVNRGVLELPASEVLVAKR
jgi:hypothetical protein